MATKEEYAVLSLYVYAAEQGFNRPNLVGWTELVPPQTDHLNGFSYGVFRGPGGEVVLAYTGTNQGVDWLNSGLAATGILPAPQVAAAAQALARAQADYGSNITLTGHSLGGGLASIMAVWFNQQAVVFDEAPFEATALNPLIMASVAAVLTEGAYAVSPEFVSFIASYPVVYAQREARVANHYLQGEALVPLRVALPTVLGTDTPISINGAAATPVQLHSMALYAAAALSPAFAQATNVSERARPLGSSLALVTTGVMVTTGVKSCL